jgi:hypothetical protein
VPGKSVCGLSTWIPRYSSGHTAPHILQVGDVCRAPAVDCEGCSITGSGNEEGEPTRLVRVPHDGDVLVLRGDTPHELVLHAVRVLAAAC